MRPGNLKISERREKASSVPRLESRSTGESLSTDLRTELPDRILIDCTETTLSGLSTGVQRVVRNIVDRSDLMAQYTGVPCLPVIAIGEKFYPLSSFPSLREARVLQSGILESGKSLYHFIDSFLSRIFFQRIPEDLKEDRLKKKGIFRLSLRGWVKKEGRNAVLRLSNCSLMVREGTPVNPGRRDLLLMPDMFWGLPDPLRAARAFWKKGGAIVPVIHDLIPVHFPQYSHEGTAYEFRKTLPEIVGIAIGILTVSKSMQKEIEDYLSKLFPERSLPTECFYLGADMLKNNRRVESVRVEIRSFSSGDDLYLMVGTIQPHKGYQVVLQAFERMWGSGFTGKLCIVGRVGGNGYDLMKSLRASRWYGEKLIVYHNANDSELDHLYRYTKGLIMASYAEGFGLPLVEAMEYGVPVVASDLPVFREVGGDYPDYFITGSSGSLMNVIKEREKKGGPKERGIHPKVENLG